MRIDSFSSACTALGLVPFARLGVFGTLRLSEVDAAVASMRARLSTTACSAEGLVHDVQCIARMESEAQVLRQFLQRHDLIGRLGAKFGGGDAAFLEQLTRWFSEMFWEDLTGNEIGLARAQALREVVWSLASHCARVSFEESQAAAPAPAPAGGEVAS